MADPVTPSPAATLVLLRDRAPGSVDVLLLERHGKSKFAAGDHVFAGGKVEAEDLPDDVESYCRGVTAPDAARRLGDALAGRAALAYWIGAIREAFEEVGILLAYTTEGEFVTFTPDEPRAIRGVSGRLPDLQPGLLSDAAGRTVDAGHGSAHVLRALDNARGESDPL